MKSVSVGCIGIDWAKHAPVLEEGAHRAARRLGSKVRLRRDVFRQIELVDVILVGGNLPIPRRGSVHLDLTNLHYEKAIQTVADAIVDGATELLVCRASVS